MVSNRTLHNIAALAHAIQAVVILSLVSWLNSRYAICYIHYAVSYGLIINCIYMFDLVV